MPNIHVYLHDPKRAALLQPPKTKASQIASSTFTTDADDDDGGRWVTIGGAHVHIGKGGKIDKGPKELMEKSEHGAHAAHHEMKAHAHGEAASGKGPKHPDFKAHQDAAQAHAEAARHFKSAEYNASAGNMKTARAAHEAATKKAEDARRIGVDASKNDSSEANTFEKPSAHTALHSDAGDDVKGSEKHEAEHARLLKEYGKSKNKWERDAVNHQISKNAEEGAKAKAQTMHHKALQASEHAKTTGAIEHHEAARSAIDAAMDQHRRAGGEGSKAKLAELEKMRKPHHAALQEHEKANPKTTSAHVSRHSKIEDARKMQMTQEKPAKVFHHPEGGYFVPPHAKASGRYEKAGHKVALDYNGKPPAGAPQENLSPRQAALRESGSPRYAGRQSEGTTSALTKIAAKHAKKAAEEAADQDPKHKK
jgi:hypothetical protein